MLALMPSWVAPWITGLGPPGESRPATFGARYLNSGAKGFEEKQSNDYYPVEVRISMIRAAFNRRKRALAARSKASSLLGGS